MDRLMLFMGSSHQKFGREVAKYLEVPPSPLEIETFPDGEILVTVGESVRGRDVFVVQSVARKPNLYLMELLTILDAMKRASARNIVAVIPYFGYARQDRRVGGRVPITAKLVANLLQTAGATRVLTMDLHAEQIQGFFDVPVDNLYARPELISCLNQMGLDKKVIVSPDAGSTKIARAFAGEMGCDYAVVDKQRLSADQVAATTVIGNVKDLDVVLTDDMVSTAGTLVEAAKAVKKAGCRRVVAVASHGLLVGEALERLEESPIEKLIVSNTVPDVDQLATRCAKIAVVSVAKLFGEAITRIVYDRSIASMFERK